MKTVAITGATAGIGRATAVRFDRAGYRVAAYGRNPKALDELRTQLRPEAVVDSLEVQDADAWATRLEQLAKQTDGRLDVLINNAGILSSGRFVDISLADQRKIIDVNVGGTLNAVIPPTRTCARRPTHRSSTCHPRPPCTGSPSWRPTRRPSSRFAVSPRHST